MKIALIRPNFGSYFQITPPLSLGYLSSSLKNNGYTDIVLVDASLDKKIPQEVNRFLKKENPDIIGMKFQNQNTTLLLKQNYCLKRF